MARRSKRSLAAIKGWKTRRKNAKRKSVQPKKPRQTRGGGSDGGNSLLSALAKASPGKVDYKAYDAGERWDTYTVGIKRPIPINEESDWLAEWRGPLRKLPDSATVIRGRLVRVDENGEVIAAHWYTMVSVERRREIFEQIKHEIAVWSDHIGPSGSFDLIDGLEISVEVNRAGTQGNRRFSGFRPRNRKVGPIRGGRNRGGKR